MEEALYELDTLKATANDNYKQRAAKLKELLNLEVLNTEERRKLELELLETNRAVQEQSLAAHRKAEEEKTKATEAEAKRRSELAESDRGLAEDEVRALKDKLARGEDVLSQLKEQVATRQKLTEEAIKEAAAVDKVGKSAADAAAIDKLARNEIQRTRAETGREVEALDRQEADRRKKSLLEALKLQDELAQAKLAADKDVTQMDLNRSAKERLDIAKKQLRLQADIESASATPEEKARIQAQLELDLYNLRKKSTEELAAASEELEKAKKKTEELKGATLGGVQSVEEFAKELNDQFSGLGRDKPEEEAGGVTEADKDRAARDLGVDRNEGVPGLDTRTEADSEPSTPGVESSGGTEPGDSGATEVEESKGGDLGPVVERLDALTSAVLAFRSDVARMKPGLQVEFMTPQGTGNDDWAYRSTRVGE